MTLLECMHMRRLWVYRFRRTTLMLMLFLSALGGIGLARTGFVMPAIWPVAILIILLVLWHKRTLIVLVLTIALGLSLGWWRGSVYMQQLAAYDTLYYQKISITVRANEDAIYGRTKQLSFSAGSILLQDGRQLAGKIQLSGFGVNAVFQGDEVEATGKLYP